MKMLRYGLTGLVVVLIVAALAAPLGPVPGFWIRGASTDVPDAWGNTRSIHEIRLQVGDGPIGRTVIIWMVQYEGDLHVMGDGASGWTRGIGRGGLVRVAMEGRLYHLNASRLEAPDKEAVIGAWIEKYRADYPDIVSDVSAGAREGSAVFRLVAR